MINKTIFFVFCVFLFSCSDKETDDLEGDPKPEDAVFEYPLALKVDGLQGNVFEQFVFGLQDTTYMGPNEDFAVFLKYFDQLDSIIWSVEGAPGHFKIAEKNRSEFTTQWGHYFYEPGKHTTFLHGFKDGKSVLVDTVYVNVENTKDFLILNWSDIAGEEVGLTYSRNDLYDYVISIHPVSKDGIVAAKVFARLGEPVLRKTEDEKEYVKEKLINTITRLYGEPAFSATDRKDLRSVFRGKFKAELQEHTQVHHIWETEKSVISLLKISYGQSEEYEIYAEPAGL